MVHKRIWFDLTKHDIKWNTQHKKWHFAPPKIWHIETTQLIWWHDEGHQKVCILSNVDMTDMRHAWSQKFKIIISTKFDIVYLYAVCCTDLLNVLNSFNKYFQYNQHIQKNQIMNHEQDLIWWNDWHESEWYDYDVKTTIIWNTVNLFHRITMTIWYDSTLGYPYLRSVNSLEIKQMVRDMTMTWPTIELKS